MPKIRESSRRKYVVTSISLPIELYHLVKYYADKFCNGKFSHALTEILYQFFRQRGVEIVIPEFTIEHKPETRKERRKEKERKIEQIDLEMKAIKLELYSTVKMLEGFEKTLTYYIKLGYKPQINIDLILKNVDKARKLLLKASKLAKKVNDKSLEEMIEKCDQICTRIEEILKNFEQK